MSFGKELGRCLSLGKQEEVCLDFSEVVHLFDAVKVVLHAWDASMSPT